MKYVNLCICLNYWLGTWAKQGWGKQQCRNPKNRSNTPSKWEGRPRQDLAETGPGDGAVKSSYDNPHPDGNADQRQSMVFLFVLITLSGI
jgi:hypothetical protein